MTSYQILRTNPIRARALFVVHLFKMAYRCLEKDDDGHSDQLYYDGSIYLVQAILLMWRGTCSFSTLHPTTTPFLFISLVADQHVVEKRSKSRGVFGNFSHVPSMSNVCKNPKSRGARSLGCTLLELAISPYALPDSSNYPLISKKDPGFKR